VIGRRRGLSTRKGRRSIPASEISLSLRIVLRCAAQLSQSITSVKFIRLFRISLLIPPEPSGEVHQAHTRHCLGDRSDTEMPTLAPPTCLTSSFDFIESAIPMFSHVSNPFFLPFANLPFNGFYHKRLCGLVASVNSQRTGKCVYNIVCCILLSSKLLGDCGLILLTHACCLYRERLLKPHITHQVVNLPSAVVWVRQIAAGTERG
jgi:hypothetical protein